MTAKPPVLTRLKVSGLLSFSPNGIDLPMEPLNVLIGPNGSGKSNLIEALILLQQARSDIGAPVRAGGISSWLWRGQSGTTDRATIEASVRRRDLQVDYKVTFGNVNEQLTIFDERIELPDEARSRRLQFGVEKGHTRLRTNGVLREVEPEDLDPHLSILAQRKDPKAYPALGVLEHAFLNILIYRDWQFGPAAALRRAAATDTRHDQLNPSLDNLPGFLARLMRDPEVKRQVLKALSDLGSAFSDVRVVPEGGRLQLYLEEGNQAFPATRLSDGTLRYLCLLSILLDPIPPMLVVIEEPELGLHPDMISTVVDLLKQATQRTQIVLTTHSSLLVSALTDTPESVIVCEKPGDSTILRRLDRRELKPWLEKYRLGELWSSGDIGGNRW